MRHGAIGIGLGDRRELLARAPIPEGMKGRERGLEARLNLRSTRDRKNQVAAATFHQWI
jgi:hypothetical protein